MSRVWKAVLGGVAALALIGALFLTRHPSVSTEGDSAPRGDAGGPVATQPQLDVLAATDVAEPNTDDPSTSGTVPEVGSAQASLPPLPPKSAPLAASIDALLQRAEAGDAVATCRVIIEFQTCRNRVAATSRARYFRGIASDAKTDVERDENVRIAARLLERADPEDPACDGDLHLGRPDFGPKVVKGMSALSNDQKVLLAMTDDYGELIRLPNSWSRSAGEPSLTIQVYPQYLVDITLPALDTGIAEANPLALEGKIILHMPTPFAKLLGLRSSEPDPYKFALHCIVMREVVGERSLGPVVENVLQNVLMKMTVEDSSRLIQEAKSMTGTWKARRGAASRPDYVTDKASEFCGP